MQLETLLPAIRRIVQSSSAVHRNARTSEPRNAVSTNDIEAIVGERGPVCFANRLETFRATTRAAWTTLVVAHAARV